MRGEIALKALMEKMSVLTESKEDYLEAILVIGLEKNWQNLIRKRSNEYLQLPDSVLVESSLEVALSADIILIAIGAQGLRSLCKQIALCPVQGKTFVLCMKGMEENSGKCLSQVFQEEIAQSVELAVWVGPGHVQEFVKNIPSCMVIASDKIDVTRRVVNTFTSELIRLYYGQDLLGIEIGATQTASSTDCAISS